MPNCSVSIPKWETEGKPLSSSPTNVTFSLIKNDTLYFELANTQTIYMYFNLNYSGTNTPSYQVAIYDALTYNLVSTLTSSLNNLSTNIDLLAGLYIVCLRSISGNFTGTVRADYYGFGRVVKLDPVAVESQQYVEFELTTKPKPKPCDKDMVWEIVDGKLPPGIMLNNSSGLLYGKLPYLDCLDDPDDLMNDIPSANLFFTAGLTKYETVEPWGRRWNFKLRISILEQPHHYEEKWFCLLIYNNWTRSQMKFFQEYDNGLNQGQIIKSVDQRYKVGLCENTCVIDKEANEAINEAIKEFIESEIEITDDDDILHIELDPIMNDAENQNSYTVYTKKGDIHTKEKIIIEDNGTKYFGAYENFHTTIDMDPDIIAQINLYTPEIAPGYISENVMIEIDSYEVYLGFRQYARLQLNNPDSEIQLYKDDRVFIDFMNMSSKVKYEYMSYDPEVGIDGVDDSKGIADEVKHYIFIYYDKEKMPEVEEIENMINKQKQKGPWELHHSVGEFTDFELVVARKYNEA